MKKDSITQSPNLIDGSQILDISAGSTSGMLRVFGFSLVKLYFPGNWTTCDVAIQESDDGHHWYTTKVETGAGASQIVSTNVVANECRSYGYFLIGAQYIKLVCSTPQVSDVKVVAVISPVLGRI